MKTQEEHTRLPYHVHNLPVGELHVVTSALRGTHYELLYIGDEEMTLYMSYESAQEFIKHPDLVSCYMLEYIHF